MKQKMSRVRLLTVIICVAVTALAVGICLELVWWKDREPVMEAAPQNKYRDTLVVAADADYQPYSFVDGDGNPAGYDMELIYLLADRLEKNVEVRLMQWGDAQKAVRNGEADILMGLDYNVESWEDFELTMPLDNDPFVAFGRESFASVSDLYGKKLATLEAGGSLAAFLEPFRLEGETSVYSSYSEAFQSVATGENDYVIAMYSVGRRAVANLNDSTIRAVGPTLVGNYLCIGTKKGNTELAKELDAAVIQLKKDGTLDGLGEKWLGKYIEVISIWDYLENNRIMVMILFVLLVAGAAAFYVCISRSMAKSEASQHEMTKRVLKYQQLLSEATKGLYESIYELDITHNRAGSEATQQYFKSLGIPGDAPYDLALQTITEKQVKEEFVKGYLDTFSPEHVMWAYENGIDRLSYDFMINSDGKNYYWMRILACIFFWKEDQSVRLITYRQNIDAEKRKELAMEEKIREDALTGLYNKVTTEELIQQRMEENSEEKFAFIMMDIDNFKNVNDSLGHSFGDYVITKFAGELKRQAAGAIVGRVGGDEFAVFLSYRDQEELERTAEQLRRQLEQVIRLGEKSCGITASLGLARYPLDGRDFERLYLKADNALYQTKKRGKNSCTIYGNEKN